MTTDLNRCWRCFYYPQGVLQHLTPHFDAIAVLPLVGLGQYYYYALDYSL